VDKQKTKVILDYMRNNWDVVLNSSVSMMKTLGFRTRLRFAIEIMIGKRKKRSFGAFRNYERPGVKDAPAAPQKPDVTPPPQEGKNA
jgi:hypothetical protein